MSPAVVMLAQTAAVVIALSTLTVSGAIVIRDWPTTVATASMWVLVLLGALVANRIGAWWRHRRARRQEDRQ